MKKKDVLIILILLFTFVVAWIATTIYTSIRKSTIPANVTGDIKPIAPNFNTQTIDKLKEREVINPSFEKSASEGGEITQ